jgi:hypothetical protein
MKKPVQKSDVNQNAKVVVDRLLGNDKKENYTKEKASLS